MKISDYIMDYLANLGIKHIFTLAGGGSMYLNDSLGKSKRITPVYCLHEQAAAIAAISYAQYNNFLGVVLVTTGPGGTNVITPVTAAWIDSVPLLVISGQVRTVFLNQELRQCGPQGVDIISIVEPITKRAITIDSEDIEYFLGELIEEATTPRKGPVWLDIPLDIQNADITDR